MIVSPDGERRSPPGTGTVEASNARAQHLRRDGEDQRREHVLPAFSAARRTGIGRRQRECLKQEDRDGQDHHRARTRLEHVEGAPLRGVGRRRDNQGRQCRAAQSVENRRRDDQVADHEDQEGWLAEQLQAADVLAHKHGLRNARGGIPCASRKLMRLCRAAWLSQ